jgi:hypothetical protein
MGLIVALCDTHAPSPPDGACHPRTLSGDERSEEREAMIRRKWVEKFRLKVEDPVIDPG